MSPAQVPGPAVLPRPRVARAVAVAAVLAGLLWVASGVLNRVLLWQVPGLPYQLVNLVVPPALDFSLRPGEHQVSAMAVVGAVVVAVVVAGVSALALRGLPASGGRVALFLAVWFGVVAASAVASVVQVMAKFAPLGADAATVNALVPWLTRGGHWGLALGWVVASGAVATLDRPDQAHLTRSAASAP